MLSQQTYALPPLTTLNTVGFYAELAIKKKKFKTLNNLNKPKSFSPLWLPLLEIQEVIKLG